MVASPACRLANRRLLFQSLSSIRAGGASQSWGVASRTQSTRQASRYARLGDSVTPPRGGTSRNPMDNISVDPAWKAKREKDIREAKFLALGLVCTIAATGIVTTLWPAPKEPKNDSLTSSLYSRADAPDEKKIGEFQGKPVVTAAAGQKIIARDEKNGKELELISTGTSSVPFFPKTINISTSSTAGPAEDNEYTLLGLGIRTVSFLSIQVYVVGLYVQTSSLAALQSRLVKYINPLGSALIAGEKDELRLSLLDAEKSYELWDKLLSEKDVDLKTAFRVVPTRSTDFGHLRDGWVRGITSRAQEAKKKQDLQFEDETFGVAMREFKALMQGKGKAPTGSTVLLTREADGALGLLFQDPKGKIEDLGTLKDERIARLVWLGYLGGKNVSSDGARKSIVEGIMELVERPIGSVETMVV